MIVIDDLTVLTDRDYSQVIAVKLRLNTVNFNKIYQLILKNRRQRSIEIRKGCSLKFLLSQLPNYQHHINQQNSKGQFFSWLCAKLSNSFRILLRNYYLKKDILLQAIQILYKWFALLSVAVCEKQVNFQPLLIDVNSQVYLSCSIAHYLNLLIEITFIYRARLMPFSQFIATLRYKIYHQMIKTIVLLLCTHALTKTYKIDTTSSSQGLVPVSKPHSLTFTNYTGDGVSSQMLTGIINFINAASGFYKDDVRMNILYLKTKLDQTYGDDYHNFFVYIQTQQNVEFSWYVFLTFEYVIAGLSNVNIVNPGWSYLLFKNVAPPSSIDYAYITPGSIGPGITPQINDFIAQLVNSQEPDGICVCDDQSIINIGNAMIKNTLKPWNVICDAGGVTSALTKGADGLWGSFKPKNCYYTLSVKL